MKGFARREFQLVLLRRMADYQPGLVEDAMRALGATRTEMRQVNARWQRIVRSRAFPPGRRRHESVLGPPAVHEHRIGDVTCEIARWPALALWPGLRFEVVTGPDGTLLREWLVRDEHAPVPRLDTVDDLVPWSCVVGDVAGRFADVVHRVGDAPSRWQSTITTSGGTHVAHFVWGLLQTVERS